VRRFYRSVTVAGTEDGFVLLLDEKPVKTPVGQELRAPNRAVAEAVAVEWERQDETIEPADMPVTRFVNSVLDGVLTREREVAETLISYASTDLLCYRADPATDAELAAEQHRLWDPPLAWIAEAESIRLEITEGIRPAEQPPEVIDRLRNLVSRYDAWRLAGLHAAATVTASAVLALALDRGAFPLDRIWQAAILEDTCQIARWGDDTEAARRRDGLRRELGEAAGWLALLN